MATVRPTAFSNFGCSREINSECPPRSKKLSYLPTSCNPRTALQIAAIWCSKLDSGAASGSSSLGRTCSGAGSSCLSTLPLAFSGMRFKCTKALGTMYSGNFSFTQERNSGVSTSVRRATTYATKHFSPMLFSRAKTIASRTPGCFCNTASISPSSMRKPRILTCWSARPKNSKLPSAR